MNRSGMKQWLFSAAVTVGFGVAHAQSGPIDVTLEVLDDVSDIDGVVVRLQDVRDRDDDRARDQDETRARDEFERSVRDAQAEREALEREAAADREERREIQNAEEDLRRDFEARERETTAP